MDPVGSRSLPCEIWAGKATGITITFSREEMGVYRTRMEGAAVSNIFGEMRSLMVARDMMIL